MDGFLAIGAGALLIVYRRRFVEKLLAEQRWLRGSTAEHRTYVGVTVFVGVFFVGWGIMRLMEPN